MCEQSNQISKLAETNEPFPCTCLKWMPKPSSFDFFATSSDILRLYQLSFAQGQDIIKPVFEMRNNSEFCGPITAFDWNEQDSNCIATASVDNTVTIWDLQHQSVTT